MAVDRMRDILGLLTENRKDYLRLRARAKADDLCLKLPKPGSKIPMVLPKERELGFKIPSFKNNANLGPIQNKRAAVVATVGLYNAIHQVWSRGESSADVFISTHTDNLNLEEFEQALGVKLEQLQKRNPINFGTINYEANRASVGLNDKAKFLLKFSISDSNKPLGRILERMTIEEEEKAREREVRKQILIKAVTELHDKIVDLLPALVEGGVREMIMPQFKLDDNQPMVGNLPDYVSNQWPDNYRY